MPNTSGMMQLIWSEWLGAAAVHVGPISVSKGVSSTKAINIINEQLAQFFYLIRKVLVLAGAGKLSTSD